MKIIIHGESKKLKQLFKELVPRCQRDKLLIESDEATIVDKVAVVDLEKKVIEPRKSKK